LLQDSVDAGVGRAIGGGLANEFSNADANAFRFHSRYGNGLPSGSLQEGVFRACHELAGRRRQLRKACGAVELVENAQQVGLFQRHRGPLGTAYLQEPLLHLVEPRGHSLKDFPASIGGQAQTSQAPLELLKLLGDIQLRHWRGL
jgi:hypothetical protein